MSELISRGAILTFSRLSNFAIQFLSPVLLVRILDVVAYGQYQEFMIYATFLTALSAFSVDSSLTYFIPRFPERERSLVVQTSLIVLAASTLCVLALMMGKPAAEKLITYDFVAPLAAYVFFFVNLNWLEYYWIAKRQPRIVLWYSALRLTVRISAVLIVAYTTRDVLAIIWSLVVVETLRVLLVFIYFARREMFKAVVKWPEVLQQLRFSAPVGAAAVLQNAGRSVGKMFISVTLGPVALAYYVTGSYLLPIVRVMRSGISDAIYPELVRAHGQRDVAIRLWQRVNVLNCVMFFPAFVVLIFYAEQIIGVLFTEAYLPAVPMFNVFAFFLLRRCFNTDVLLRTTGRTGFMLLGTFGALTLNVALIFILSPVLGMVGPAIAFLVSEVALELYYARLMLRTLEVRVRNLADWVSILRILISCVICLPILIALDMLPGPGIVRIGLSIASYFAIVFYLSYRFGVSDIGRVATFMKSRLLP